MSDILTLTIGSVVRLRSGGPLMTINCNQRPYYGCVWFDDDCHLQTGLFSEEALVEELPEGRGEPAKVLNG